MLCVPNDGTGSITGSDRNPLAASGNGCGGGGDGGSTGSVFGPKRVSNIGDAPCITIDIITIKAETRKSLSLPGRPANTGSSTRSNELSPLGPNQAISRRP